MGNSQAKEARPGSSRGHAHHSSARHQRTSSASGAGPSQDRPQTGVYSSRSGRGSRPDLSFLGIGSANSERDPALEPRRETKAEREARKLEKERAVRIQERERSIREEGVDGGYLVTLGTYTGPEDFSKPVVRQLQIERRLAPFWKGLNDHSDSWTEYQLVAVVNGLPLPAPDEIPPDEPSRSNNLSPEWNPRSSNSNINNLTVPISSRSMSQNSDRSASLSPSHPAFSLPSPTSPIAAPTSSSSPFFRGRAKTLAALTTGSRNSSQTEMTPQEIQLPKDPYVNGQRIEAFLYKNASECPICFMYYPPYLNKTRCCDQPICSECFVQIKRPDPHPPEHHDPNDPNASAEPQEENQLVSEPAACPFCVQPEFGITYEPPPFRRGLVYANQGNSLASAASAMSSTSSLNSQGLVSPGRRRATSLAANDAQVITTDRVRPDWAKKLADARAHALRRAAAATALHNAAYMMGNLQASESRGLGFGRRRRTTLFASDSAGSSGQGTPRRVEDNVTSLFGAANANGSSSRNDGQSDLTSGRHSSRRGTRLEDLEELMMMEAIRLSLAAEEERKKKEEKEAAKEAKKEEKKKAKEMKKAEKAARKSGFFSTPYMDGESDVPAASSSATAGKGKAVDRSGGSVGFNPLNEPTSTLNISSSKTDPQKHLEQSRAQIQRETSDSGNAAPFDRFDEQASHRAALRNVSNASSSASSLAESSQGSLQQTSQGGFGASASSSEPNPSVSGISLHEDETPPQNMPGTEPMFNFRNLEAVISSDSKDDANKAEHVEDVAEGKQAASESLDPNTTNDMPKRSTPDIAVQPPDHSDVPTSLEESVMTIKPTTPVTAAAADGEDDDISPVPEIEVVPANGNGALGMDTKHIGDIHAVHPLGHQPTQ